jgi:hypothetical protein
MKTALLLTLALTSGLFAQRLKLPPKLEALSKVASETVDVTVDGSMLRLAEKFLSDKDADEAKAKRILRGLNNVYVRVFEFDRPGLYSMSDLDEVRAQLRGPGWSRMVEVQSRNEDNVEVYAKLEGGEVTGMVVLAAEPKELSIVQIDGPIRPEDIASLSGRVGMPNMHFLMGRRR